MDTTTQLPSVTERVAAGMAWIKELRAAGRDISLDRIDLDTLDLHNNYRCVIAQATGRMYFEVMGTLTGLGDGYTLTGERRLYHQFAVEHGIQCHNPNDQVPCPDVIALLDAWREAIRTDRDARADQVIDQVIEDPAES